MKFLKTILLKNGLAILLGLFFTGSMAWIYLSNIPTIERLVENLNNATYDLILQSNLQQLPEIKNDSVAVIAIDDASIREQGRWPWSRKKIAQLVKNLKSLGATVIAFDILFSEPEINIIRTTLNELNYLPTSTQTSLQPTLTKLIPYFDYDRQFSDVLQQGDQVLGFAFKPFSKRTVGLLPQPLFKLDANQVQTSQIPIMSGYLGNIAILQNTAKYGGFLNSTPDSDGALRYTNLLMIYNDGVYPSLSLEAIRLFLLSNKIALKTSSYNGKPIIEGIQLENMIIPTDEKGRVLIPFRVGAYAFPYFSATDILKNKIAQSAIAGKIIFIGATSTGLGDLKTTALTNNYPGVEVHASVASAVLDHYFPSKPSWTKGLEFLLILTLGLLGAFIFPFFNALWLAIILIVTFVVWLSITTWLWITHSIVLILFFPLFTIVFLAFINMINSYLVASRQRKEIKSVFGQYVPQQHIETILKSSNDQLLSGESKDLSILFADIREFTTIAETMSATQLKMQLNEYLTAMTKVIFNQEGTIDKYVGDMIMAFWNAPLVEKNHAQKAVLAGLEMQEQLIEVNNYFTSLDLTPIQICIGINTGPVNVGDMGSKYRRAYTAIGDAVNLASRLESMCRYYGIDILVGEETYKLTNTTFAYQHIDKVRVKGKNQGVDIYLPINLLNKTSEDQLQEINLHDQALDYYFNQQWIEAKQLFAKLVIDYPTRPLYKLYHERVQLFSSNPPSKNWDGVYISTLK